VQLERHAEHRRDALAREVVLRRTHAAAHHDEIGARGGLADGGVEVGAIVADEGLPPDHHAELPQPVHEPGGVRVDDLPGEELVARREDLDVEAHASTPSAWSARSAAQA
jgi:hypothetical protein